MPFPLKSLLFVTLLFQISIGYGSELKDTVRRSNPIQTKQLKTENLDQNKEFLEGIEAIKQDSVPKGIHLMADGLHILFGQTKLIQMLDYDSRELIYTIQTLDEAKLSAAEMHIGQLFLRELLTKQPDSLSYTVQPIFDQAPNTIFILRIKTFYFYETSNSHLYSSINELLSKAPGLLSVNILKAKYYYDKDNFKECIKWCDASMKISPDYTYGLLLRGKCYKQLGIGDKAIADFDVVLKSFPYYAEPNNDRSEILLDSDKYREAVEGFNLALRADPDYGYPAYNLARCYKALEMRDSALICINLHISQYPEDGDGYNLKAEIFDDNQDYQLAISFYDSAIKLDSSKADFYENRGDAYLDSDSLDMAISDYKKAISLDKKTAYREDRLGDCYYRKESYDTAISYYQSVINTFPTYKYAYVDIDIIYNKQGKFKLGMEMLKKAVSLDSTYSTALGNLGWEYYSLGDYNSCIKWSYKALNTEPNAAYAMFNIALATLCTGDFEKAKERYSYFFNLCKQKDYKMNDGATNDLRDLIKSNRFKEQAEFIIQNIFGETP